MLYDDGEEEDEDMASQPFRFCPALLPLDDSLLHAQGQPAADLEDVGNDADRHIHVEEGTVCIDPVANIQSIQPNLQQAAHPTACLDANNVSQPLCHNPEAAGISSQGNKHMPVPSDQPRQSALSTDKQAAVDAAAASDAHTAVPIRKTEHVQQAAGPQRQADAFDYPASQAENVAAQQPAPSTAGPSNCKEPVSGPGRGRDRGRKRAPSKQVVPAKRQKQLQVPRGRAASKALKTKETTGKQVADGPHHQPRRSRLAGPACQVMGTSPSHPDTGVKVGVKPEPQGDWGKQAWQQIPSTDAGAHTRTSRQLASQQGRPHEQQPGHKQDSLGHHQQQQPADDVAEQVGKTVGKTEVVPCLVFASALLQQIFC